jgi:hypothetical protein
VQCGYCIPISIEAKVLKDLGCLISLQNDLKVAFRDFFADGLPYVFPESCSNLFDVVDFVALAIGNFLIGTAYPDVKKTADCVSLSLWPVSIPRSKPNRSALVT